MLVLRSSSRMAMAASRGTEHGVLRRTFGASSASARSFASSSEPPRSQSKPAQPGETKAWMPIAGIGAGLGAVFFYLMSQPNNAPKVAHATGQNLPELTSRDSVDEKSGRRMGTHKAD